MTTQRPDEGLARLASYLEARADELDLDWVDVARDAGITPQTLRVVRRGGNKPSRATKRGLDRAMKWEPGGVTAILAGGEPTPVEMREVTRSPVGELIETTRTNLGIPVENVLARASIDRAQWDRLLTLPEIRDAEIPVAVRAARAVGLTHKDFERVDMAFHDELLNAEVEETWDQLTEQSAEQELLLRRAEKGLRRLNAEELRLAEELIRKIGGDSA